MTTRRQVQTPGKPAEQAQEDKPPLDGEKPDLAVLLPAILESLHRIEERLANGSQVEPAKSKPKKGRFKFIEGKGHVWVEG